MQTAAKSIVNSNELLQIRGKEELSILKFKQEFNLKRTAEYTANSMKRRVGQSTNSVVKKFRRNIGLRSLNQEVNAQLDKAAKEIKKDRVKPKSIKDYLDFGVFYVSKIFLLIVFLAVIIGSAVAVKFVYPAIGV